MKTKARIRIDAEMFRALVAGMEVTVTGNDTWHDLSSGEPAAQPYEVKIILADIGFAEMLRTIFDLRNAADRAGG